MLNFATDFPLVEDVAAAARVCAAISREKGATAAAVVRANSRYPGISNRVLIVYEVQQKKMRLYMLEAIASIIHIAFTRFQGLFDGENSLREQP